MPDSQTSICIEFGYGQRSTGIGLISLHAHVLKSMLTTGIYNNELSINAGIYLKKKTFEDSFEPEIINRPTVVKMTE